MITGDCPEHLRGFGYNAIELRYLRKQPNGSYEPREFLTAKETLAVVWNGWLHKHQIDKAREMAASDATEEECEKHLQELERECSRSLAMWRAYQ